MNGLWVSRLRAFTAETPGKGKVLGLDGDTFGMNSSQVGVLEERDEVSLSSFLESHNGGGLEAEIGLEVLSDFTDEPLEGELADEELGGLLVTPDLTESDGTGAESVGLLDTTSGGLCGLSRGLGCELLTGGFASGRFAGGLLGASHLRSRSRRFEEVLEVVVVVCV